MNGNGPGRFKATLYLYFVDVSKSIGKGIAKTAFGIDNTFTFTFTYNRNSRIYGVICLLYPLHMKVQKLLLRDYFYFLGQRDKDGN